jgi:hypothetical protein
MVLEVFTAAKILEIALTAVIETGSGKFTEGAIAKAKELWQKIGDRLKSEPTAEAALVKVESEQSKDDLEQVVPFLQVEMIKDKQFAEELQNLAQQFKQLNISNTQDNSSQTQIIGGTGNKGFQAKANEIGHFGDNINPG